MTAVAYLHLRPGSELPAIPKRSVFKAVIVVEAEVDPTWREDVGRWLV